jgi:hypothetical protein
MERLRSRTRRWTALFIVGLPLSGVTALPIPTEVEAGASVLGEDMHARGLLPEAVGSWLRTLRDGIRATSAQVGFVPVWLRYRWTGELLQAEAADGRPTG